MKQPKNYNNVQGYDEFEALKLGGHICKIMGVKEQKSSTGKDMIVISLDIAEGEQKDYYGNMYRKDSRPITEKKWGCIVYQLIEDKDGNTNRGFKTFINSVAKSNKGFDETKIWDEKFCEYFKDKLIGGVFGREQYRNQNGELKWSTKCIAFRDIDTIKKGVEVPEDKYLPDAQPGKASMFGGFEDMTPDVSEDSLPF
jgi:hypothetical protein